MLCCWGLASLSALSLWAANTKETVSQVTSAVELTTDVDYVVNGETPFADDGVVNIVNTDHAVLIIERVKPSKVIASLLANRVKIKGAVAKNNVNCQVRLYGTRGAMILPYASTDKPLTVYSEQNFQGEKCSDFGLENDGGYMVTLTDQKLNSVALLPTTKTWSLPHCHRFSTEKSPATESLNGTRPARKAWPAIPMARPAMPSTSSAATDGTPVAT